MKPFKREAVKRKKFEMKEEKKNEDSDNEGPIIEELKPVTKKTKKTLSKRNFGSMVMELTQGIMDSSKYVPRSEIESNSNSAMKYADGEDSASKGIDTQSAIPNLEMALEFLDKPDDEVVYEIDTKLESFKFKANTVSVVRKDPPKSKNMKLQKVKLGTASKKIDDKSETASKSTAANSSMSIDKFSYGKKQDENRLFAIDDIENPDQKLWLEIYDYEDEAWYHIEPTKCRINPNNDEIKKKLHGVPGLFVITFQKYEFASEGLKNTIEKHHHYYMKDLSSRYMEKYHKIIVSRRELRLDYWWNQICTYYNFRPDYSNYVWKAINFIEDERTREKERADIPQHPREFRASKYYVIPSLLKKHEGFHPDTKPLENQTFKDEPIYEKSAVCSLHSKARWKREMRRVLAGQAPVKKVLSAAGQGENIVDLYGIWQTEEFVNELGEDGSLPKNEYGNYEVFNGELPKGVVHLNYNGMARIAKKLGIEYVDAIIGFEMAKNGRAHAVKGGIIAHERDEKILREGYAQFKEEIDRKEREKLKNEVVGLWKGIFRKILVKKYIQETYYTESAVNANYNSKKSDYS